MTGELIEDTMIETRRAEVLRGIVKGKTMAEIARELGVAAITVYKDYTYIRANAQEYYIENFVSDLFPIELMKCLTRINMVSDRAWKMADEADNIKDELACIVEAKKASIDIITLMSSNKEVVETVFGLQNKGKNKNNNNNGNGKDAKSLTDKELNRQQRLPGSVAKEIKEITERMKREELQFEEQLREESEDDSTTGGESFEQQDEEEREEELDSTN